MSEQRVMPEVLPGDLITRVGLYEARCGDIVRITGWRDGFWVSVWNGVRTYYSSDGRQRFDEGQQPNQWQLLHWVGPLPATEPEPETTTEQLVGIEGQTVEPEPVPEPVPVQVREGRWRTRGGEIKNIRPCEPLKGAYYVWPWTDGFMTYQDNGRHLAAESDNDLVEYLGPIEEQPQPQPEPQAATIDELRSEVSYVQRLLGESRQRVTQLEDLVGSLRTINEAQEKAFEAAGKENTALRLQVQNRQQEHERHKGRIEFLEALDAGNAVAIVDYRAKVEKLQGLVDTARGQLEAAATERDELRAAIDQADKQLDQKDAQIRDLRIELDAAQQVPQPVSDEERERIWDDATEQAGQQVIRWLTPLTLALHRQPDERFLRFMALTLSVLPSILPQLLGYAVEDETDGDCEE